MGNDPVDLFQDHLYKQSRLESVFSCYQLSVEPKVRTEAQLCHCCLQVRLGASPSTSLHIHDLSKKDQGSRGISLRSLPVPECLRRLLAFTGKKVLASIRRGS